MREELILPEKQPLFELCTERLAHWSGVEDTATEAIAAPSCKYLIVCSSVYGTYVLYVIDMIFLYSCRL